MSELQLRIKRFPALAVLILLLIFALAACGSKDETSTSKTEPEIETNQSTVGNNNQSEAKPLMNISEIGNGTAYISTPSGTSENGNIPTVYADQNTMILQIGLTTRDFDYNATSFVYVDAQQKSKEHLADSQTSINLMDSDLSEGTHYVEIVQYKDDDQESDVIEYKLMQYEVKAS